MDAVLCLVDLFWHKPETSRGFLALRMMLFFVFPCNFFLAKNCVLLQLAAQKLKVSLLKTLILY